VSACRQQVDKHPQRIVGSEPGKLGVRGQHFAIGPKRRTTRRWQLLLYTKSSCECQLTGSRPHNKVTVMSTPCFCNSHFSVCRIQGKEHGISKSAKKQCILAAVTGRLAPPRTKQKVAAWGTCQNGINLHGFACQAFVAVPTRSGTEQARVATELRSMHCSQKRTDETDTDYDRNIDMTLSQSL